MLEYKRYRVKNRKEKGGIMSYNYGPIVEPLLAWFDENRRILPWREDPRPYYVWVSEIMLQQTRVEAVKGYFARFTTELPTIQHLAEASEEKLLKFWEGLGYYNRVRNLQKAAQQVVAEYDGVLPDSYEELIKLPGIGSYTAGAIASIAYQKRVPAVDGNVLRIVKRLSASFDDITKQKVVKEVEKQMKEIMPVRSGDFNQALMDLGATVCIPNGRPLCDKCPISEYCEGRKQDVMMLLPVKPSKKPRKIEEKTMLVLEYESKYALNKRPKKGLLAGLWEIPNVEGRLSVEELNEQLQKLGVTDYEVELLGRAKHIFSHIEWHMLGYHVRINKKWDSTRPDVSDEGELSRSLEEYSWMDKEQLKEKVALPTAFECYKCWEQ